jgi:hypothetical protein
MTEAAEGQGGGGAAQRGGSRFCIQGLVHQSMIQIRRLVAFYQHQDIRQLAVSHVWQKKFDQTEVSSLLYKPGDNAATLRRSIQAAVRAGVIQSYRRWQSDKSTMLKKPIPA